MTTPDRTASVSKISHPKDQVKPKSRVIRLRNFETKLDWALYLARKGFSVFPLWWAINGGCACDGYSDNESDGEKCGDQGKHPLWFAARHGFKSATRDRRAIWWWWTKWPEANIGIALDEGWLVLDIDPRHGGDVSLKELEAKLGALTITWTVRTGNGLHYYFTAQTTSVIQAPIAEGVDLKIGGKGYVVGPGSTHLNGSAYRIACDAAAAELPDGWRKALPTGGGGARGRTGTGRGRRTDRRPGGIGRDVVRAGWWIPSRPDKGERNTSFFRLACRLRRFGKDEAQIEAELLEHNQACQSPLSKREIRRIARSAARYDPEPRQRGLVRWSRG
jgi:putative DNA primase/helicase